ncbi:MAG: TIR domain-containing protein [Dysgonamonadaceae bacterium]|jgi:predicted GTPase|nr:TIR domain-containing protein [Dysgonamonadaceae bacterium]
MESKEYQVKGFLSYSTQDDEFFNRKDITRLKQNIENYMRRLSGIDIPVFQYAENMKYGQILSDEIKRQMQESSFFIPIITPNYFMSQPCREEFEYYMESLKSTECRRIFPIYFADIDDNVAALDNEAINLYNRYRETQLYYCDLRKLQIDETNSDYIKTIESFSKNICKFLHPLLQIIKHVNEEPSILICGATGVGKTTTVNTLFGKKLGHVEGGRRGTTQLHQHTLMSEGGNVIIYDVPGLGDSKEIDKQTKKIYSEIIKLGVGGIIVVIVPPRPAAFGTLETVKLLISKNVDIRKIVFGYNKLSYLRYDDDDGENKKIADIDSLFGPVDEKEKKAIDDAKDMFFQDLNAYFPDKGFKKEQIIEYDSISGWNFYKMFETIAKVIPPNAAIKLKKAVDKAHNELVEKQEKKRKSVEEDITITDEKKEQKIIKINTEIQKLNEERETFTNLIYDTVIEFIGSVIDLSVKKIKNWINKWF